MRRREQGPQDVELSIERVGRAVVVDAVVSARDLLCERHLRGDARVRRSRVEAISPHQALSLKVFCRGHDDDGPKQGGATRLKEQRGVVDHQRRLSCGCLYKAPRALLGDAGVRNAFETSAGLSVSEDASPERRAVERARGIADLGAEGCDDLCQGGRARPHDVSRDGVRVHDARAPRREASRDRAFATRDAARQPDDVRHGAHVTAAPTVWQCARVNRSPPQRFAFVEPSGTQARHVVARRDVSVGRDGQRARAGERERVRAGRGRALPVVPSH